jgi:ubiquinone biosynthesis protein UbiJ
MEKSALLTSLELLLNKTLSLDEKSVHALADSNHKVLAFRLSNYSLFMVVKGHELIVFSTWDKKVDTIISSTLQKLIPFALSPKAKRQDLMLETFEIQGDLAFAESLETVFLNFEPNWLPVLSKLVGEDSALHLQRGLSDCAAKSRQGLNNFFETVSEYLQEEVNVSANHEEVEDFCQEVDELVLDVDRLERKLTHLKRQKQHETDGY